MQQISRMWLIAVTVLALVAAALVIQYQRAADRPTAPPTTLVTVAAVGDIACRSAPRARSCEYDKTAQTVVSLNPDLVIIPGDLQYEHGELSNFQAWYDSMWGRFKANTYPVPGNHEWETPNAQGYRDYWSSGGPPEMRVSPTWYSFDRNGWHFIALDSNCDEVGGCGAGSIQFTWLKDDLATNTGKPTVAYWHHARFSSGRDGGDDVVAPLWELLVKDADVQVAVVGHNHSYERFTQMGPTDPDPNGLRQFVSGQGGKSHHCMDGRAPRPGSEVFNCDSDGVLKLTLKSDGGYDWEFVSSTGAFTDSGTQASRPRAVALR